MTCSYCEKWMATSRVQLENRLDNMAENPQIDVYVCPECGSAEWSTTTKNITDWTYPSPPRGGCGPLIMIMAFITSLIIGVITLLIK